MKKNELDIMRNRGGFIAALDQSGGSTPKALKLYGVDETAYSNEEQMYEEIHKMRSRIMTSPAFTSQKILGAILFEMTLDKLVEGVPTATYLNQKGILPFLKIDLGLASEENGVQLMKPITQLDETLKKAAKAEIFGTKMRSVIKGANPVGIRAIVEQQFDIAKTIIAAGLVPIIEPEVDITIPDKAEAEDILLEELKIALSLLSQDQQVVFKLSLPTRENLYLDIQKDSHLLRVVALSGGYTQSEANAKLAKNTGVIASFSRALSEGLSAQQNDEEFNAMISQSIDAIFEASKF